MKPLNYKYHEYIDTYMDATRTGKVKASKRLLKAMDYIETKIGHEDIF